jgi:hypothetical protein
MSRGHRFSTGAGVVLALGIGSFHALAGSKRVEKAESRAEINEAGSAGSIVNRTFEAIVESKEPRLLRKETQRDFDAESEGGPGRVRIDAWHLPRVRGDKPLYTISEEGDDIGWLYYPELLTVRTRACCSSSGSRTVFNARTGKMVVYANGAGEHGNLVSVARDGEVILLIGVHDDHGGRRPRAFPPHTDGHLPVLVTTADASTCRRQILFDFPTPSKFDTYIQSVTLDQVKAWSVSGLRIVLAHGETLKGVLRIEVSDKRTVSLPVSDDGVDASRVQLPSGVKMATLSPCVL